MLKVTKFKNGELLRNSTKKDGWASLMLVSEEISISNGFVNNVKRIGFIRGPIALLNGFNLTDGDDFSKKVQPCKIIIKESMSPSFDNQEPKKYPASHDKAGQEVLSQTGQLIYRETVIVPAGSDLQDVLIASMTEETAAASAAVASEDVSIVA